LAQSPGAVCLHVDDAHRIRSDSPAARLLDAMIERLPANGHLVLAGRREPPCRLARLRLSGELVAISESALRFTDAEAEQCAQNLGVESARVAGAGGWPALVQLRAAVPASEIDYLQEEVLAGLDPGVAESLRALSVLGPVEPQVLTAALGRAPDLPRLASVPLVDVSDDRLAAHELWADRLGPTVESDLRQRWLGRAATELGAGGRLDAAVRLLLRAGQLDACLEQFSARRSLVEPAARAMAAATVSDLRATVPADREEDPAVLLLEMDASRDDWSSLRRAVDLGWRAVDGFRRVDDAAGERTALIDTARASWQFGLADHVRAAADRLAELPSDDPETRWAVRLMAADAADDLEEVLDLADGEDYRDRPWALYARARALVDLGRPEEALGPAGELMARAAPHETNAGTPLLWALSFTGNFHDVLAAGVTAGSNPRGTVHDRALAGALLASVYARVGRVEQAAHSMGVADDAITSEAPADVRFVHVLGRAVLAAATGRPTESRELADEAQAWVEASPHEVERAARPAVALLILLSSDAEPFWRDRPLGPAFSLGRELATAVVLARNGSTHRVESLALPEPDTVAMHLGVDGAVELAALLTDVGRRDEAGPILDWVADHAASAGRDSLRGLARSEGAAAGGAAALLSTLPAVPTERVELALLGPPEIRHAGASSDHPHWRRERVRTLLAALVVRGRVERSRLAAELWPDFDERKALRNLKTTLNYLNEVLEPRRRAGEAPYVVRSEGANVVLLERDGVWADLWEFDRLVDEADRAERSGMPSSAVDPLGRAVRLWRGEPFALVEAAWADMERHRLRDRALDASCRAAELVTASGQGEHGRELARTALGIEPLSERAHRALVSAHLASGDRAGARRALAALHQALDELEVPADEATEQLEQRIALGVREG
ncbi:MAG: BTAD domain-containing putative transcriptional regulator, partial [Actinomycetota bacterium]